MRSRILLIVDGLGDHAVPELGGQTPLEAAETPNLDYFAACGEFGLVDPIAPGVLPNTDTGTSLLMGLEPDDAALLKRGPIEAAGAGLSLQAGQIAMRANFATAKDDDGSLQIVDRRAGRTTKGLEGLSEAISDLDLGEGVSARFYSTDQHRGVMVLEGEGLDAAVTDTDPGDSSLPADICLAQALRPGAERTAGKINDWIRVVRARLARHEANSERVEAGLLPANAVITRGAGAVAKLRNKLNRAGRRVAVVTGCNTIIGLGRLFRFDLISSDRFTADMHTDLDHKIVKALAAARDHDVVMVHVKAPDVCAHDLNPVGKMQVLERLDAALGKLKTWHGVLGLSADHTTDSNTGRHTADPVPSLLCTIDGRPTTGLNAVNFGEAQCRRGNMSRQISQSFVDRFLER